MVHPGRANVPKEELSEKVALKFKTKKECIVLFGFKTKFGGGKSSGFALIYDSLDYRKKYDTLARLRKVELFIHYF